MHKFKNKKLLSIFLAGMISYISLNISDIYATGNSNSLDIIEGSEDIEKDEVETEDSNDSNDNNSETEDSNTNNEIKTISVSDINNDENIGLNIKTKGSIINISGNKINIKDETGEGLVCIEEISVSNLQIGDIISVQGIIDKRDNQNVVIINDVNNLELIISEEKPSEDNDTDDNKNNKPDQSINKPSQSTGQSKPSGQGSSSKTSTEEITVNGIKGKDPIIIETDLTTEQWEKVKLQLENNNIKVKDLKNNKIRISKVNNNSGDNIWIVNDPRMLYSEETKTIGVEIVDALLYSEYDVSENTWNTIVEDVKNGDAKIKFDSEKNVKVIYQKSDKKDSIITLERIVLE